MWSIDTEFAGNFGAGNNFVHMHLKQNLFLGHIKVTVIEYLSFEKYKDNWQKAERGLRVEILFRDTQQRASSYAWSRTGIDHVLFHD